MIHDNLTSLTTRDFNPSYKSPLLFLTSSLSLSILLTFHAKRIPYNTIIQNTYTMRKHLIKLKVSRLISSFKSCRSKDPSTLPSNPIPISFLHLSPSKPLHFSLKRHVSSALLTARNSFSRPRTSHASSPSTSHFKWEKHSKWHVMAKIPNYDSTPPRRKIYTSAASEDDLKLLSPPPQTKHTKRRRFPRRRRLSTSSDSGIFSDDGCGDESETLISTDTSTPRHRRRNDAKKSTVAGESVAPTPARLSEFMRKMLPCKAENEVVEGKMRESFAIVKRSEDPYEDFRRSMAEMVVEKEMFERGELEELLRCFLELNSEHLHGAIVRAFVDIWESLFCHSEGEIRTYKRG